MEWEREWAGGERRRKNAYGSNPYGSGIFGMGIFSGGLLQCYRYRWEGEGVCTFAMGPLDLVWVVLA